MDNMAFFFAILFVTCLAPSKIYQERQKNLKQKLRQRQIENVAEQSSAKSVVVKPPQATKGNISGGKGNRNKDATNESSLDCQSKKHTEIEEPVVEVREEIDDNQQHDLAPEWTERNEEAYSPEFSLLEGLKDSNLNLSSRLNALTEDFGRERSLLDQSVIENESLKGKLKDDKKEIERLKEALKQERQEKRILKSKAENGNSLEQKVEKLSSDIERMKEKKAKKLEEKDTEIENLKETLVGREEILRLFEAEKMKSEDVVGHDNTEVEENLSTDFISTLSTFAEVWRLEEGVATYVLPTYWSRDLKDWCQCAPVWDFYDNTFRMKPIHWFSGDDALTEDEDFYSNPMKLKLIPFDGQSIDWNAN